MTEHPLLSREEYIANALRQYEPLTWTSYGGDSTAPTWIADEMKRRTLTASQDYDLLFSRTVSYS